jgi:hypothetical protein
VGAPPKLNQDGTFGTDKKLPVREELARNKESFSGPISNN